MGMVCAEPSLLKDRLLVSGLQLIDRHTAAANGYGDREVIVPTTPRQPTTREVAEFTASDATLNKLRLVALPLSIGEKAIRLCADALEFHAATAAPEKLDNGFFATDIGIRVDAAGQANVSLDPEGCKVGEHIDTEDDPLYRIAVLNMGPGKRWHRLTPAFSREELGNQRPEPDLRNAYMKNLQQKDEDRALLAYWIRLDPPVFVQAEPAVEALLFSPVANYLHDGATLGAKLGSTAIFIAPSMDSVAPSSDNYPSLI